MIASLIAPLLLLSPNPVHAALTPHAPIYINGNGGFTKPDPVNGGGSGTLGDPYIIENWNISAGDDNGIEIKNTTKHFIVRNCYVHGSRVTSRNGICLDNVVNGRIDNNRVENNYGGIALYSSSNNTISNNIVKNTDLWSGIYLGNSNNNLIENCTVENGLGRGIMLHFSSNNTIENCTVENNDSGIYLSNSDNNILDNNACENNDSGIYLDYSDNNTLTNNTCENSGQHGIHLWHSGNNLIENCIAENSGWWGIWLDHSPNNCLRNNTLTNNTDAFGVWSFENVSEFYQDIDTSNKIDDKPIYYVIEKEDLIFDGDAMDIGYLGLISCENILVKNLNISNVHHGILVANTSHSTVANCVFSDTRFAMDFWVSSNNIYKNCIIENNYYGISSLQSSENNIITNCTFKNNWYGAWFSNWWDDWSGNSSNNNLIYHNNFINNTNQAYDNCSNFWDDGYPSGGNYWGDYTGEDNYKGKNQNMPGPDGIGDTPYPIPSDNNRDRYPLMNPWTPPAPPVGGIVTPVNKLVLLVPWIVLAVLIAIAAVSIIVYRRRVST